MPNLYIIAGCNGAGKTTASFTVLPEMLNCDEFINADEIARGLSPLNPDKALLYSFRSASSSLSRLIITYGMRSIHAMPLIKRTKTTRIRYSVETV